MKEFCHLHCHTSFSLLDGAARIDALVARAADLDMHALGITDHGNLFGVPEFYTTTRKAGLRPVIGCEFYVTAEDRRNRRDRVRFHQVLWAKNEKGYRNLMRLSSLSYTEGFYYKPRIDHGLLKTYGAGLVATTCCLQGEVPQNILKGGETAGRRVFEMYYDIFGEDYYIELQNHNINDQRRVNAVLLTYAKDYGVKVVATNDVHYVEQADSDAQDVLLCLQTGKDYNDATRMRFENDQFYLKTAPEMKSAMAGIDSDIVDESLATAGEIADKCQFELEMGSLLMPHYPIPEDFGTDADAYLEHLVFEKAQLRYPGMSQSVVERLQNELGIIREMGYASYFLIVQDFTTAARELGVAVGPGRGSAAGSAVAYCLGITNIDPLRYGLLFERFLNPERISMPDIDIDFDDRGRGKVIDYVINKYGRKNVCQIITFGTMGARSVIRDVARVLNIPLAEADRIARLIPEGPKVTLNMAMDTVKDFRALKEDPREEIKKLLQYAQVLEGSARHTGVHAAGVIIAPGTVSDFIPVAIAKNKDDQVLTTQYDGNWVERFGLLKMDFLGLSTLTVIEDTLSLIEKGHGAKIDIDAIPLDDGKTFELFQRGDTIGIFQFESEGMREWITQLKPTRIDDLIAMNALYRPGPMDLIPNYIKRKHGEEEVSYPHAMLKPVLEGTYGIPVFQEQVMRMAQVMGGYTLGRADLLRRAMGKKKQKEMDEQRAIFVEGARKRAVEEGTANEVFDMMAKFAGYGFNKCLVGATKIMDARTGRHVTLEHLFVSRAPCAVHALSPDGRLRVRRVTDIVWNGWRSVFELRTRLGKRIVATANHPFLTTGGWTPLERLSPGDRIGAPSVLLTEYDLSAEDMSGEPLHPAPGGSVASEIARATDVARSIDRLFARRGFMDDATTLRLWFKATSEQAALETQALLLRLGVVSTVTGAANVCVRGTDACRLHQHVLLPYMRGEEPSAHACLAARARDRGDVIWDTVVSIRPLGVQETYDITVESDHNFVANGLIVHNSHSAAYSLVAYHTAYLKANYPAEFLAAAMTNEMGNSKKLAVLLEETRKANLDVLSPSIHHSRASFTVEDGKIRCGLGAIKGVGLGAIQVIVDARAENEPARTLFGFAKTLDIHKVGKKALESLARVGAMDNLEGHRAQLVAGIEGAVQFALRERADRLSGQISLFGDLPEFQAINEPSLPKQDPWSKARLLKEERELIGFYISGHPLEAFKPEVRAFATVELGRVAAMLAQTANPQRNGGESGKPVHAFCGIITDVKKRTTRKGKPIAFAAFEDFSGQAEMVCFATILDRVEQYLKVDEVVLVRGEVEIRGGNVKILTREVTPMWKVRENLIRSIVVNIDQDRVTLNAIKQLRVLCNDNRGSCRLYFDIVDHKLPGGRQRIRSRSYVIESNQIVMQGLARIFGADNVRVEGEA